MSPEFLQQAMSKTTNSDRQSLQLAEDAKQLWRLSDTLKATLTEREVASPLQPRHKLLFCTFLNAVDAEF
jgi:hypothetical protein